VPLQQQENPWGSRQGISRSAAVEEAIKAIEAATDRPQLRSIAPLLPKSL
jgi:hypothetical protein